MSHVGFRMPQCGDRRFPPMLSRIAIGLFCCGFSGILVLDALGQDQDISSLLDRDTAALVRVLNLDRLDGWFGLDDREQLIRMRDLAQADPFPILTDSQLAHFESLIASLKTLAGTIDNLEIVIHRWEDSEFPQLTIIIDTDDPDSTALATSLLKTAHLIVGDNDPRRAAESTSGSSHQGTNDDRRQEATFSIRRLLSSELGKWKSATVETAAGSRLIFTNCNLLLPRLVDRNLPPPIRPLRDHRPFQSHLKFVEKTAGGFTLADAYVVPSRLKPVMLTNLSRRPDFSQSTWDILKLEEISVATASLQLLRDGAFVINTKINATFPPSGMAKQWSTLLVRQG